MTIALFTFVCAVAAPPSYNEAPQLAALVAAHEVDPRETATLFALTQLLMAKSDWARAREYAQTLLDLDPSAADVQRLLNEIQLRQLRERSAVRNRGGVHD